MLTSDDLRKKTPLRKRMNTIKYSAVESRGGVTEFRAVVPVLGAFLGPQMESR